MYNQTIKYGESTFDILYLLFAVLTGIIILIRRRNKADILMGSAAMILGLGDSFHLVPRVLNYFIDKDFTWSLGFGKLVTSITMTVFYILVFHLYKNVYSKEDKSTKTTGLILYVLVALRTGICLLPILGMLMLPKTVCYILMLVAFIRLSRAGSHL